MLILCSSPYRMLRVTGIRLACRFEHPGCENATHLYKAWMEDPSTNK